MEPRRRGQHGAPVLPRRQRFDGLDELLVNLGQPVSIWHLPFLLTLGAGPPGGRSGASNVWTAPSSGTARGQGTGAARARTRSASGGPQGPLTPGRAG